MSTDGFPATLISPRMASTPNHAHITGPNRLPTLAVPCFWIANSTTMITSVTGTMNGWSCGAMISRPSTAPSTEIAGVIMPSP